LPDALAAIEAGADALGFMFYAKSARFIEPARAAEIVRQLPPGVTRVGVFVDAPTDEVRRLAIECGLDALQFHGAETPAYCAAFGARHAPDVLRQQGRPPTPATAWGVIKAFRIRDAESLQDLPAYHCDAWLLDSFVAGQPGGTGARFDWELAAQAARSGPPLILAGGLTPDTVAQAVRQVRPYAVDVSSGVESAPGCKDAARLRAFIRAAREA